MTISVIRRRPTLADLTPYAGCETRDSKVRCAVSTRLDREARADDTPARDYAGDALYSGSIPRSMQRVRSDAKHTGRAGNAARAAEESAHALASEVSRVRDQAERLTVACATARNRAEYQGARDALRAHCARYGLPFAPPARGSAPAERTRFVVWG